jgi:hypothetical protein
MLKRTDWRALQWIEALPAEPVQLELPFPSFRHQRLESSSQQLVLLFPSAVSAHDASSPDSADESLGGSRCTGDRKNK